MLASGSLSVAADKIFILAGQSNMNGEGRMDEITEEQRAFPDNVKLLLGIKPTDVSKATKFGPELTLARGLSQKYPDDTLYFIKMGPGGSSLYYDWAQEKTQEKCDESNKTPGKYKPLSVYDPNNTTSFYHRLINRYGYCKSAYPDATVEGIFWMQGEQDCRIVEGANNYAELLRELAECLRRDLNCPDAPFIYGQINCRESDFPLVETVKAQQRQALEIIPNSALVETGDLGLRDPAHFSSESLLKLGDRFADAYISLKGN